MANQEYRSDHSYKDELQGFFSWNSKLKILRLSVAQSLELHIR